MFFLNCIIILLVFGTSYCQMRHIPLKMNEEDTTNYIIKCTEYKYFYVDVIDGCKDIKIAIKQIEGEPNLYVSKDPIRYPTLKEMVWSSYEQGDDLVHMYYWDPFFPIERLYIGVHSYCGDDIPNKQDARFTISAKQEKSPLNTPDLFVLKEANGIVEKRKYSYHYMCIPNICTNVTLTLSHCKNKSEECKSYGYPELIASTEHPHVSVNDEVWLLADGGRRTLSLNPTDPNMKAGRYFLAVYGWCTDDDKCPPSHRPQCGPCSMAANVTYNLTLEFSTIQEKRCEKMLIDRNKKYNNLSKKFSYDKYCLMISIIIFSLFNIYN